jgi:hypothetical protein
MVVVVGVVRWEGRLVFGIVRRLVFRQRDGRSLHL